MSLIISGAVSAVGTGTMPALTPPAYTSLVEAKNSLLPRTHPVQQVQRCQRVDPDHPRGIGFDIPHAHDRGQHEDEIPPIAASRVRRGIGEVRVHHRHVQRRQFRILAAAREVVDDRDTVAVGNEPAGKVQSDKPRATQYKHFHAATPESYRPMPSDTAHRVAAIAAASRIRHESNTSRTSDRRERLRDIELPILRVVGDHQYGVRGAEPMSRLTGWPPYAWITASRTTGSCPSTRIPAASNTGIMSAIGVPRVSSVGGHPL